MRQGRMVVGCARIDKLAHFPGAPENEWLSLHENPADLISDSDKAWWCQ
jgi:hypothetical protein